MVNVPTIAGRELRAYFYSPLGYVVLAVFLLLQGIVYWLFLSFLAQPSAPPGAVMQYFFGGTILFWIAVLGVTAAATMRLLAEERRAGTLEPLLTAPVTSTEVVLGKYLAAVGFFATLWLPTLLYVAILRGYADARPEWGPIAAGYLGTLLEGATFLAVGLLASALTRNQLVAFILAFVVGWALLLLGVLESLTSTEWLKATFRYVHLFRQMDDFGRGIVDTRHLAFLLSVTGFSLFTTVKILDARRSA
jgi:ABC-type transport system involved in multi-copper enzyme maturation permease subunit